MSSMLHLDQDHYEAVARWRQRTGGQLAGIWNSFDQDNGNHLKIFFGNLVSDRPLETPILEIVSQAPDPQLDALAQELWKKDWDVDDPQIMDFTASMQRMRCMVVTSGPLDPELAQKLLRRLRDNVDRDLPDYLLTA